MLPSGSWTMQMYPMGYGSFIGGVASQPPASATRAISSMSSRSATSNPSEALARLRPAVSRRVAAVLETGGCRYLEDGRPVAGVPDE